MDNLEEMDRFLEELNFTRLNQDEIEIMNPRVSRRKEILKIRAEINGKEKRP